MKHFNCCESTSLQFGAEAFQLFNHPIAAIPDTAADDEQSFSKIFGLLSLRILQTQPCAEVLGRVFDQFI
jgi:hypothetical protein